MIRIFLALALAAGASSAAQAQTATATGNPNGIVLQEGQRGVPLLTDLNGRLLTAPTGGAGSSAGSPSYTTQAPVTRSASVVTLPAGTPTQLAPAGLKTFFAQNQGSNPVIVGYDNTVCTGTGATLAAANGSSPGQATYEYPASTTAYWACSVAGSSVAVVRGQ